MAQATSGAGTTSGTVDAAGVDATSGAALDAGVVGVAPASYDAEAPDGRTGAWSLDATALTSLDGAGDAEVLDGLTAGIGDATVLALPGSDVSWVGVAGAQVYFSLYLTAIDRVPANGGATSVVAPAGSANPGYNGPPPGSYAPNGVAFDAAFVYWSESVGSTTAIKRAPLDGGSPQLLALSPGYPAAMVLESGTIYWIDQNDGEILSVPVTGACPNPSAIGNCATVVATGLEVPAGIAARGGTLYLTDADGDLLSIPADGGVVTTLFKGPGLTGLPANTGEIADFSVSMAVDDDNVYFPQYYVAQPNISRAPLDGGAPTVLLQVQIADFVVDANNLYWLAGGNVNETPLGGGPVRVLASNQSFSTGPVLDDHHVYWGTSYWPMACGLCPPARGINAVVKVAK